MNIQHVEAGVLLQDLEAGVLLALNVLSAAEIKEFKEISVLCCMKLETVVSNIIKSFVKTARNSTLGYAKDHTNKIIEYTTQYLFQQEQKGHIMLPPFNKYDTSQSLLEN